MPYFELEVCFNFFGILFVNFLKGFGSKYGFALCPADFRVIVREQMGGKGTSFLFKMFHRKSSLFFF